MLGLLRFGIKKMNAKADEANAFARAPRPSAFKQALGQGWVEHLAAALDGGLSEVAEFQLNLLILNAPVRIGR